jgi:hypothetical protein
MSSCPVFEAERRLLNSIEDTLSIKGFAAAHAGREKIVPQEDSYCEGYRKAWEHGWSCYHQRFFPWALECRAYRDVDEKNGIQNAAQAQQAFKLTGKLPAEVEVLLKTYSR